MGRRPDQWGVLERGRPQHVVQGVAALGGGLRRSDELVGVQERGVEDGRGFPSDPVARAERREAGQCQIRVRETKSKYTLTVRGMELRIL